MILCDTENADRRIISGIFNLSGWNANSEGSFLKSTPTHFALTCEITIGNAHLVHSIPNRVANDLYACIEGKSDGIVYTF